MVESRPVRQLVGVVLFAQKTERYLVLERCPQWYQGWGLIQGGIEAQETPLQAGVREVYEEVGIKLNEQHLTDLHYAYTYLNSLTQSNSHVQWFVSILDDEPVITLQADEWLSCQWLPYHQAVDALVWDNQREVLRCAQNVCFSKK